MSIVVIQPGVHTSVQDRGRVAWQHIGVPVGGAMDSGAHRIANLLVGNSDDAASLECTMGGVALRFQQPALIALAGRALLASLDGAEITAWRPIVVERGQLLSLHSGGRTSIAIAGGIDVPIILGGRGTSSRAAFGGFNGRALRRDDIVPVGTPSTLSLTLREKIAGAGRRVAPWGAGPSLRPAYAPSPTVRLIAGQELPRLTAPSRQLFLGGTFAIAGDSDRMGYRLLGQTLSLQTTIDMDSSGVTAGTVQLPPGGAPIVLMADRQTTGGYPRLGSVIGVDLPLLAQLLPGDSVQFVETSLAEAHRLFREREHDLARAREAIRMLAAGGSHAGG
jgi:antagonist of KipI